MKRISFLILVVALFVSACGGAQPNLPDTNALSTQIAATVNAAINNALPTSVPNIVPTKAPIVPPPAATQTPAPTKAPLPNGSGGSFSPITFAIGENHEQPVDAMDTFPGGVTMIYAIFSGVNVKNGDAWRNEWYLNGKLQDKLSASDNWDAATAGPDSVWWLTVFNPDGVRSGQWELKLYVGENLVQSGQVTVEANVEPDFGPITFAGGVDSSDQPVNPVEVSDPTFPAGTKEVYAFFSGINMPKDTAWQTQWFLNGEPADSKDHTWNFGLTEEDWIQFGSTGSSPLDPGTYELKLSIDGAIVNIGSFVVSAN
ncbi:MAG TPA: hypothetical protein VFF70_09885 [Anaerolineae bacterium]|nr:hypothetical protein [Anaerolineae bacterium]